MSEIAPTITIAGKPDARVAPRTQTESPRMTYNERSSDEELRSGCLNGHRLAQKYLYQRYYGRFLSIPLRYTSNREDAQDVLNQAFLKIFHSMEQYRFEGTFSGWMARIVLFTAIDHVRSRALYKQKIDFNSTAAEPPVDSDAVQNLATEDLHKLIGKLPDASRTVFCLYVIDGYKHAEIASMLGIDEGTSKWHLSEARRRLKAMFVQHAKI